MKTETEITERIRLIDGLILSNQEGLVKLTDKKINDLEFEVGILGWALTPSQPREELRKKKIVMPIIEPFQNIPRATKEGGIVRDKMLAHIKEKPLICRSELAKLLKRTNAGTIPQLDALIDLGLIKQIKFRDEVKFYHYSTEENDEDMEKLLDDKRFNEIYDRDEKRKDRLKQKYHKDKPKSKQNNDWKKAKKIKPMLDRMKDEKIFDGEKWTKAFSEKMEDFKKDHTQEEYEELLNRMTPLSEALKNE